MILHSKVLGKGPVLIILHGLFGSLDNWFHVGKGLSTKFQVHLLDQRNHGKSIHTTTHTYLEMAEDVLKYIQYYNLIKPTILGHSMGGKTAMAFALKYPKILKKLIVVDIAPKTYKNTHEHIINLLVKLNGDKIKSRKKVEQKLKNANVDLSTVQFLSKNLYWINDNELKFRFNIDTLNSYSTELMGFDFLNHSWTGETIFIKGDKSNYITSFDSKKIKLFFPNFDIINIKNAGHWVHFDQREEFLKTMELILI